MGRDINGFRKNRKRPEKPLMYEWGHVWTARGISVYTLGRCRVAHVAASEVRVNATAGSRKGRNGSGVDRNEDEMVVRDVDGLGREAYCRAATTDVVIWGCLLLYPWPAQRGGGGTQRLKNVTFSWRHPLRKHHRFVFKYFINFFRHSELPLTPFRFFERLAN